MRIVLLLLLAANTAFGQGFFLSKDSARISMLEGLPSVQPFDTAHKWQLITGSLAYIISEKDLYSYFGYEASLKYRDFDFANRHILGEYTCGQCRIVCRHEDGITACHRNRCMYGWVWWIRDNKKAFRDVAIEVIPWHRQKEDGGRSWMQDTVMQETDTVRWMTTGWGDCHASYEYRLLEDVYHRNYILVEHNYYGGCRAGGSKPFTIVFRRKQGTLNYFKHTVLEERK